MYFSFKDKRLDAGLADMQLIFKYNEGIKFLLCVTDNFNKYTWVVTLNDKKSTTIND